jgi:peptidoglycan/LPS O-acetylase OafA/YrhL
MFAAQPRPLEAVSVRTPRLDSLTGLRWIAALTVFAFHLRNIGQVGGAAQEVLNHAFGAGATGVSLFFILSGFVLTWTHRPDAPLRHFWQKRFARIYPLHLVGVVLALVLAYTMIPRIAPNSPFPVIANLALVSSWNPEWLQVGNPVSWTLVCEAFFYLVFPFLIAGIIRLRARLIAGLAVLSVAVTVAIPVFADHLPAIIAAHSSPIGRLPEFVLGICLGRLLRTGAWRGPRLSVGIIAAVAGFAWANHDVESPLSTAAYTVVGFALLTAALARADIEGRPGLLATRPLVTLGAVSYAFYLFHLLVLESWISLWNAVGITRTWSTSALIAGTGFLLALGVSWLAHRYIELPGVRLLNPRLPARKPVAERSESREFADARS